MEGCENDDDAAAALLLLLLVVVAAAAALLLLLVVVAAAAASPHWDANGTVIDWRPQDFRQKEHESDGAKMPEDPNAGNAAFRPWRMATKFRLAIITTNMLEESHVEGV